MTDLFEAQSLEDPRAENIQLDENVIAGKAVASQSEYCLFRDLITSSDS